MEKNMYKGNVKILGFTTLAFFLTFVVWFNMAPFMTTLKRTFDLSNDQVAMLAVANVALTIPARVLIGILVDRFGPRKVYAGLLILLSIPCFTFALSNSFMQLMISRMFLAIIGAGFVVGIRLVSEWFPSRQVGLAEGIYGGWGNFGSAAAAMTLPTLALIFGGDNAWRYAIGLTGLIVLVYGFIFMRLVKDTPEGVTYKKPKKSGALEICSYRDLIGLIVMTLPVYGILAFLTYRLSHQLNFISSGVATTVYLFLGLLLIYNVYKIWDVNKDRLKQGVPENEKYNFKQVAILQFAYFCTFGSELAVVSVLPQFYEETFTLGIAQAGLIAGSFAFMNLVSRPGGGWLSDRFGRKKTLILLMAGLAIGYIAMSLIGSTWPIWLAIIITMSCSFFVQAGEGAVYAMVPLVNKSSTGQISGMVGAFGNIGATVFLTIFSFVSPTIFFICISCAAVVCFVCTFFLKEPESPSIQKAATVKRVAPLKSSSATLQKF
ncbi:NarK family nitrate/nitrite MFS transporter [Aquibacillus koreensis]|uniref:Nitrate/nitrite transporter n=1 Tax=Aquibacillus koreensis TaxID=279446 RepID=A0A9X3WMY8_9BACI|nr:NarK family nitrate/nitrite MFS transporter [Aquibacillus koreensis]MCT2537822.1 NarK family nitrate/nitrite MFS transporter [Aquibacillus koreensis]MDC3421146.1 NarK family nitrate/nitrite MFS transporter [Aquibacillus koreensis]